MYYLIVWDKISALRNDDGCVRKVRIPDTFARKIFKLDPQEFPLLSSLSFDDYDLFSGNELENLVKEFRSIKETEKNTDITNEIIDGILEAQSLGSCVLFDPFRNE